MTNTPKTVAQYLEGLAPERQEALNKLRETIKANLPSGFEEQLRYGMIGYVVPLSRYPAGYHVDHEALPFMALASQKHHIGVYHMGLYGDPELESWFVKAYQDQVPTKLDMGKSCIRLKNVATIPYDLIGELAAKMTVDQYLTNYEKSRAR